VRPGGATTTPSLSVEDQFRADVASSLAQSKLDLVDTLRRLAASIPIRPTWVEADPQCAFRVGLQAALRTAREGSVARVLPPEVADKLKELERCVLDQSANERFCPAAYRNTLQGFIKELAPTPAVAASVWEAMTAADLAEKKSAQLTLRATPAPARGSHTPRGGRGGGGGSGPSSNWQGAAPRGGGYRGARGGRGGTTGSFGTGAPASIAPSLHPGPAPGPYRPPTTG
jgi:hypothetical protein